MKPIIGFCVITLTLLVLVKLYSLFPPEKDGVRAAVNDIEISLPEIGSAGPAGH
jgi:hypothetical protein